MKAKINKDGTLMLERMGELKNQCCPFTPIFPHMGMTAPCGLWCPHFQIEENEYDTFLIKICHGKEWLIHEFVEDNDNASLS